jgi:hyperosmotically inducible periplasmic protein
MSALPDATSRVAPTVKPLRADYDGPDVHGLSLACGRPRLARMKGALMQANLIRAALAAAIVLALGGCDRDAANGTMGQRLDSAIDRTEHKLAEAGKKAEQQLAEAGAKTQQTLAESGDKAQQKLAEAGDKISQQTANAVDNVREATSPQPAPGSAAKADSGGGKVNDAAITASIKTDYLKDPDLSVFKIDVDTKGGVVTLNGLANDDAARVRAERIASAVKGVREVRNFLVVKRA